MFDRTVTITVRMTAEMVMDRRLRYDLPLCEHGTMFPRTGRHRDPKWHWD